MQNYAGTVVQVLNTRFTNHVVSTADEEEGKAQLTRAAVYEISLQDSNVGHYQKLSGNQSHGLSVDAIVHRLTGELVDIATSEPAGPGLVAIRAGWFQYPLNPADAQKYVPASAALALLPGPMPTADVAPGPGPGPNPPTQPPADNTEVMQALAAITTMLEQMRQQQAADTARIMERNDINTDRVLGELNRLSEELQATAKKVLAIWLASREGTTPPIEGGGGEGEPPSELVKLLLKAILANRPQMAKAVSTPTSTQKKGAANEARETRTPARPRRQRR